METEKVTAYHWLLFGICLFSNVFAGTTSTLMSVYMPEVTRDILAEGKTNELSFVSAYVSAIFVFGMAIGGMTWGILSDRFGRSRAIIFSIGFYGLFTLLTGFTNSWIIILICRLMTGFGVGGVMVVTPIILSEVWPKRTRSIFIGILSIGFPVGIFSAGLIDFLVANWHQAFLVGLIPFVISLLSILWLQESTKWTAARNEKRTHETKVSFDRNLISDLLVGSIAFGTMLIGLWAVFSWLPTWLETLVSSEGQEKRGLAMMILGGGGLVGGFFSGWLSNAMGHRRAMMLCFAVSFVMSFLLFKVNTVFSEVIYVEIAFLALFFGASQGVLSAYIPELFPTTVRATATGFCFNIGRLFTAPIVFFVGALVVFFGDYGNAIFVFSWVFAIGLITTFFSRPTQ